MTVITGRPKHPAHAHLGRAEAGNKLQHLFHRGWVEFVTRGANTFVIKEKLKMSRVGSPIYLVPYIYCPSSFHRATAAVLSLDKAIRQGEK